MAYTMRLAVRRRTSGEVQVGSLVLGGDHPVSVQSMLTCPTWDVSQVCQDLQQLKNVGCQLTRVTVPTRKDLKALPAIRQMMKSQGLAMPLVADIHFNAGLAKASLAWVEKVRINPGNFVDQKRFKLRDYTTSQYQEELQKVATTFAPLLVALKQQKKALRIGVNHGSLSDRILNRWGDTPEGMVQCALEYLVLCQRENFKQVVVSMKASNPLVAVAAYRLLAKRMQDKGMDFPLHLGVTEAGDGLAGRCKSAVGIGTLLCDGLGDTLRVSLTEPAEAEIPVAQALLAAVEKIARGPSWHNLVFDAPAIFQRRPTRLVKIGTLSLGNQTAPALLAQAPSPFVLPSLDKQEVFDGQLFNPAPASIHNTTNNATSNATSNAAAIPLYPLETKLAENSTATCLLISNAQLNDPNLPAKLAALQQHTPGGLLVLDGPYWLQPARRLALYLEEIGLDWPLAVRLPTLVSETDRMQAAIEIGALAVDGLLDALICPDNDSRGENALFCQTLMQSARLRTFSTEYISCPSCGRTLFDLQKTTARIKASTNHLKGLKIGVMGCIVNGPGEMADADFGYVGGATGKINLYKGQKCVEKGVPEEAAVSRLIELIKSNGAWHS